MSIETPEADFLGLPRLTHTEGVALEMARDEYINPYATVHGIAIMVLERNPILQRVIDHDIQQYYEYEADDGMLRGDKVLYGDGIQDGYEFFIGCMTWVRWQRSGIQNLSVFLEGAGVCGDVPLVGKPQLEQIKRVRSGNALLEAPELTKDVTSKDAAFQHTGEYLYETDSFKKVLDTYIAEEAIAGSPDLCPLASGIRHGVENAIEMYIVAYEEEILFENLAHLASLLMQLRYQGKG